MFSTRRLSQILFCTASLSACTSFNPNGYTNYEAYVDNNGTVIYPENYDYSSGYPAFQKPAQQRQVIVPKSYYVGEGRMPTPHKNLDTQWVQSQNPQGYTIILKEDKKASRVANTLYKTPKTDRTAQIKYQSNGETQYKGVYGSYGSYDAAQKALNALPDDLKQNAQIKPWGSIQQGAGQ